MSDDNKRDENDCFPGVDWHKPDESLIGVPRWEDLPLEEKLESIRLDRQDKARRAQKLAENMRKRYEYKMPDDMADQLVQYAIAAGEAIGYPEEYMKTDLDDCFITLSSSNYKIKEVVQDNGDVELLLEENYDEQNLLTGKWTHVVRSIMTAPCTPQGIRQIVYEGFLHVAKVNLDSAINDVMNDLDDDS